MWADVFTLVLLWGFSDDRTVSKSSELSGPGFVRRMEGGSVSRLTCSGTVHFLLYFTEARAERYVLTVLLTSVEIAGVRSCPSMCWLL